MSIDNFVYKVSVDYEQLYEIPDLDGRWATEKLRNYLDGIIGHIFCGYKIVDIITNNDGDCFLVVDKFFDIETVNKTTFKALSFVEYCGLYSEYLCKEKLIKCCETALYYENYELLHKMTDSLEGLEL